jgi:hypothetical protein
MSTEAFERWIEARKNARDWYWVIKRLAGNDTLATAAHQAGPYLPKSVIFSLFPTINDPTATNPDAMLVAVVDSHNLPERDIRAVWYNTRTRNECRITRWGGGGSPVLDPDSTGSILVMAFFKEGAGNARHCRVWLCNKDEEEILEGYVGEVEPGIPQFLDSGFHIVVPDRSAPERASCWLTPQTLPPAWANRFPTAVEIVDFSVSLRRLQDSPVDKRLLARRDCEYQMFRSVEEMLVLPRIIQGFSRIDEFIEFSNSVNNRRKSRAGRSFELHLAKIFDEEGVPYSHGEISEGAKRPDFLFPSANRYRDGGSPLWMLAAKTTCKDRWRQILNEAQRVPIKHLATLQEGVSINQYQEMRDAGVRLVVPAPLHKRFPELVRGELIDLRAFVGTVKNVAYGG